MACFIEIIKLREQDEFVEYQFYLPGREPGVIKVHRETGDMEITKEASYDSDGRISERAARALARHWTNGEYPDKTCWAS